MKLFNRQTALLLSSWWKILAKIILRFNYIKKNQADNQSSKKRVAFCYLGSLKINHHTNQKQQEIIISVLEELGFDVTLMAHDSLPINKIRYDHLIGFGISWRQLSKVCKGKKILYATEAPPFLSYLNEAKATMRAEKINNKTCGLERAYNFYFDDDYLEADAILQMGDLNYHILKKIQAFSDTQIFSISSFGLGITLDKPNRISYTEKSFIWFGSHGVTHKGLDKVIEAFRELPELTLYVAGCSDKEFSRLNPTNNTKHAGMLDVRESEFISLTNKCMAFILPSASEGISTAAITCMYRGLVPIVTPEVNIDMTYAIQIENSIPSIIEAARKTSSLEDKDLLLISTNVRLNAIEKYNENKYRTSIKDALEVIL